MRERLEAKTYLHRGLNSVLSFKDYTIETFPRFCLQWSPIVPRGGEAATAQVRKGRALYYWVYPNLMLNWYDGYLDTNLVLSMLDKVGVPMDTLGDSNGRVEAL